MNLPLPKGHPKLEVQIKGVEDYILHCLSCRAISLHLHEFSISEDNVDNIKGWGLLQSALIKLTQLKTTKYLLKLLISNNAASKIANLLSKNHAIVIEVPNIEQ